LDAEKKKEKKETTSSSTSTSRPGGAGFSKAGGADSKPLFFFSFDRVRFTPSGHDPGMTGHDVGGGFSSQARRRRIFEGRRGRFQAAFFQVSIAFVLPLPGMTRA
jgi:hypothetical protein